MHPRTNNVKSQGSGKFFYNGHLMGWIQSFLELSELHAFSNNLPYANQSLQQIHPYLLTGLEQNIFKKS
jgi:hypothetical protein